MHKPISEDGVRLHSDTIDTMFQSIMLKIVSRISFFDTPGPIVHVLRRPLSSLVGQSVSSGGRFLRKATCTRAVPVCLDASSRYRLFATDGCSAW